MTLKQGDFFQRNRLFIEHEQQLGWLQPLPVGPDEQTMWVFLGQSIAERDAAIMFAKDPPNVYDELKISTLHDFSKHMVWISGSKVIKHFRTLAIFSHLQLSRSLRVTICFLCALFLVSNICHWNEIIKLIYAGSLFVELLLEMDEWVKTLPS